MRRRRLLLLLCAVLGGGALAAKRWDAPGHAVCVPEPTSTTMGPAWGPARVVMS